MNEFTLEQIGNSYDELDLDSCSNPLSEGWIFETVLNIVKPKSILEIGFYRGGSAFLMMSLSDAKLTSIDPIFNDTDLYLGKKKEDEYTIHAKEFECVEKIRKQFGRRFKFIKKESKEELPEIRGENFDLLFLDGCHHEENVRNDFGLAIKLKIPYVLADDWVQPPNGPKSVPTVYSEEFSDKFKPMASFYREAFFMGSPIPMVLLKNMTI